MKEKVSQLKEKLINGLNKFYLFIDRVGKRNFILAICILFTLVITGLYVTFSLYTSSEGLSVLDGIKTYKFILGADNTENSVTIAAGASKNIAITISNNDKIKLQYGIYYTSSDDLTDVELGYLSTSDYLPNGLIEPNQDYIVTIKIYNNSSSNITIKFGITYGMEQGGDLVLEETQHWLGEVFNRFLLSEAEPGTYVAYTGTNGCPDGHCDGTNANYVSDTDMGYCTLSDYKFSTNGWKVGYIQNDTAYLISAGSTECMGTCADGTTSDSNCSDSETTEGVPLHLANLDSKALTYCNPTYAYGGVCNSSSAWAMDAIDFEAITGSTLNDTSCFKVSDTSCGYGNDLIDNGGWYWYATAENSSSTRAFIWLPYDRYVNGINSLYALGVRPILRLASSVQVVGGSGTYEDPYQIENPTSTVQYLSDVEPGSYVAYTGTNGCPDGHCDGTNANYVNDTDMGYCYSSDYEFSVNGWRVGYIQNSTAYLVSAGAPECMCTNSDGTTSNSNCTSYETNNGVPLHLANLDTKALTYCNSTYAFGGACDSNSAWAMDAIDFEAITGSALSSSSCFGRAQDASCGYGNDLIDNGGFYWFATPYTSSSLNTFTWNPSKRYVYGRNSNNVCGVRPVLRLASTVQVVGGSGTYEDPYQISPG